jgi:hypothetical protein
MVLIKYYLMELTGIFILMLVLITNYDRVLLIERASHAICFF